MPFSVHARVGCWVNLWLARCRAPRLHVTPTLKLVVACRANHRVPLGVLAREDWRITKWLTPPPPSEHTSTGTRCISILGRRPRKCLCRSPLSVRTRVGCGICRRAVWLLLLDAVACKIGLVRCVIPWIGAAGLVPNGMRSWLWPAQLLAACACGWLQELLLACGACEGRRHVHRPRRLNIGHASPVFELWPRCPEQLFSTGCGRRPS